MNLARMGNRLIAVQLAESMGQLAAYTLHVRAVGLRTETLTSVLATMRNVVLMLLEVNGESERIAAGMLIEKLASEELTAEQFIAKLVDLKEGSCVICGRSDQELIGVRCETCSF